jgi:uncharacterized membrane protein YuzA (DUF378 family)
LAGKVSDLPPLQVVLQEGTIAISEVLIVVGGMYSELLGFLLDTLIDWLLGEASKFCVSSTLSRALEDFG